MAAKYWYVAGNGNSNWNTAGVWYNGPGGTGGTTTTPTTADDAYLDQSSGSGILTIIAAASCLSLNCTGFTGTLAGTSTLNVLSSIDLSPSMTLTYSGTITLNGSMGGTIFCQGKSFAGNVTFNNASATWTTYDFKTVSTSTVTLSAGELITYISTGTYGLECGIFVSTGTGVRSFWKNSIANNNWNITGVGTVWNVSGSNITCWNLVDTITGDLYFQNSTASAKTITHTLTGLNVPAFTNVGGTGSGTFTVTGNFYYFYVTNTGGASISFGTTSFQRDLDFGTSNVNWNSGATTLSFIGITNFILSPNMTITNSGSITVTGSGEVTATFNGKSLTGTLTINTTGTFYSQDTLTNIGVVTVTSGTLLCGTAYFPSISSSNSNVRTISISDLYLTGTGTLATATTTTNLTVDITNIYVTNSTATAKSLTLNSVFYPSNSVYLAGSGSGTMTLAAGTNGTFSIYVTNTGGAIVTFSTATILSLEFSTGTNAVWSNSTGQTLTIGSSLSIATSASNPTLTPSLIFTGNGAPVVPPGYYGVSITLNGKSLVTGTCTLNDSSFSANAVVFEFDGFSSNAAFTVTSASEIRFNGAFSGPSYTSTSASTSFFYSSLTLTGALSLANNSYPNNVQVDGNFSSATISHLATGIINLNGTTNNVTTSVTLNNATSLAYFAHFGTLTTTTFTITNGNIDSYGNLNCTTFTVGNGYANFSSNTVTLTGIFTLTSGGLSGLDCSFSSTTFVSTATANSRSIFLDNSSWALAGTGTVWNVVDGGTLSASTSTLDIYINNTSVTAITFAGAGQFYGRLFINRGSINTNQVTITGSNSFQGLYHTGGSTQTLIFPAGIDTFIYDTFAVGSSSAVTNINSSSGTTPFNIVKALPGLVICNNVSITRSAASELYTTSTGTWYAINSTSVAGNSGWIFGNPSRELGINGVG
jgi:hypothetical protein